MIIGRLRGEVATVGTDTVMIDVNGVGYVALAGGRLLGKLQPGKEATLHIETRCRRGNPLALSTRHSRASI